jgi:hypothetical protein
MSCVWVVLSCDGRNTNWVVLSYDIKSTNWVVLCRDVMSTVWRSSQLHLAAGLGSHPRSTWQRPRSKRAGRCSRQHGGRWQAWEQLQSVRVAGMRTTSISAGARPLLHNTDGRQRFQRKSRKDIVDGNTEPLISAVESRCIRAIERALGGAGWFGFQQALRGILGTLFWRKT